MRGMSRARLRPKTLASAAGVAIGALVVTTMAVAYEGYPTTKVDLNDAGVWLTKTSSLMVGHFNNESTIIDGGLRTTGQDYDILQDERNVLVVDPAAAALTAIDPAHITLTENAEIPADAKVALGANTVAVLDRTSGNLWVVPFAGLSGFNSKGAEPIAELGKNSDVTVGSEGTVHAVSGKTGDVVTVPTNAQGEALEPSTASLDPAKGFTPTITAVGQTAVVLDASTGAVMTPGGLHTEIGGGSDAVLQSASAAGDDVLVATGSELIKVPLDGGDLQRVSAGGTGAPATPVSLRGCDYGAWAGSARFVRDCAGDAFDVKQAVPGAESAASLTFRVNRDVIVLNDIIGGAAWLADETLMKVDDWSVLTPPDEGDTEDDERTTEETIETTLPERSEENTAPTAEDDEYGVRPGATTMLSVLDNDNDPDGDVLVATVQGHQPQIGDVQQVLGGTALQITVPEDASGAASFRYQADDGRGGKDDATVSLRVHGWDENRAPRPARSTKLTVESGGTVSYNLLPDWIDPDGDDIYLQAVTAAPGDEVDFSTDGQLTYSAIASLPGRKEVHVTVADALGETASSVIQLDVRPSGTTLPLTNADHVTTRPGEQVTVAPLSNDTSSGREQLRLTRVEEAAGATISRDYPNKQFTFRSDAVGTYYVQYEVAAGPNVAPGLVRIDVLDDKQVDAPPVAVRDVAMLPSGGEVLLNALANDSDPSGGILVLQSVTVDPSSRLSVSVLNHETLRIGDQGGLTGPARMTYRISNGKASAEGEVVVIPIPAPEKILPPVANDDEAFVRAGDVVTIPVLDNDSHPNGDAIHVVPALVEPVVDPADGEAFTSQDTVRFRAGTEPKQVNLTYEVVDSRGQKAAAYVKIQVLPVDAEKNAAPRPRDLTVRTLAGLVTRVAIPLDGIDSDGDSVELLGLDSAPEKGRVTEIAQDYLAYEAFDTASGTDAFTYRVRDRLGKEGVATVRVGIAPPEEINRAPYAMRDSIVVRPGREVAVPALANDSDPEGGKLSLVTDGLTTPKIDGLSARISGDRVLITVPDREFETSLRYTVSDELGATATAAIQVTVDEDVPLAAPIARDDRVLMADVKDETTVDIDILGNDEDPDGTTQALDITVEDGAELQSDDTVRVSVREEQQLIRYTITDADGLSASAFLFVPASSQLRPVLTSTKPLEVRSGETKVLPLAEYVTVAGGGSVVITEAEKVSAPHSDGSNLVQDESTLVYTSAEDYFGPDGLTFEVTDGTGPDDPEGRKATLTIPITVLPPETVNQQPTLIGATMTVAPGEEATTINLAPLASDPDPGDDAKLSFEIDSRVADGITARLDGSTLAVEAAQDVAKGTTAAVRISVTDGTTEAVSAEVMVTVSASTRELAIATNDVVPELHQGDTATVPVLQNDINPFPDTPLAIIATDLETGRGEVMRDGDQILVTPEEDFVGLMVVRYRVQDATKDADREVDGRIELTVQGVPDAPGMPAVTSVEDRTVVMSWSSPVNNGAEITSYTVRAVQGGSYTKQCDSTTCTLDGLTNNVEYAFEVIATNRVGDSEPSPASEIARPDARPDTPNAPTLLFGDKKLTVNWTTPSTPGSPVEHYTLQISPAPPSGVTEKAQVVGNSLVWEGLENGVPYQVRVQAFNRAPDPSTYSQWSVAEIPAGPPAAPAQPTTTELTPVGDRAQIQVNWQTPANNGDPLQEYELQVMQGSSVVNTLNPGVSATSQAIEVATSETAYTFRIRAKNKADWGEWSPLSAERRGVIRPDAPTNVTATPGDRKITVSYSPGDFNGARASEINMQYQLGNGSFVALPSNNVIETGVANGTSYTVRLRAVSSVGGNTYPGAVSAASAAVIPYGQPNLPSISSSVSSQNITWTVTPGAHNGRDFSFTWSDDRGNSGSLGQGGGNITKTYGWSTSATITVTVKDAAGQTRSTSASRGTGAKPPPVATVGKGSPVRCEWGSGTCNYVTVSTSGDFPAGNYVVEVYRPRDGYVFGNNRGHTQYVGAGTTKQLKSMVGITNGGETISVRLSPANGVHINPTTW